MNRQVVLRAALIALGTVIALAVLEVGIRVSFFLGQPLSVTAKRFPPALAEDCGPKETWAKTGHLIFPSENPDLVYELKPNIDTCYFGARVFTNDQGLRADRHYAIPKPPNTYRILLLGDSQTFGQGVEFEDTYGQVLERQLNQASNGPKVEVINGG